MTFVATLDPPALWRHLDEILSIPRASKQEGRMRDYVVGVAERAGLRHAVDAVGNLVVRKPATAGHDETPVTILQGHLDMVNEKNADVDHDFTRDPIIPKREGAYLTATGTTLGSDNGIGVAAMLAVLDATDLEHGPLECLFTIDEETGLTGAAQLDPSLLEGRRLLNLDSEEEGALYVGCAGGGDTHVRIPLTETAVDPSGVAVALALRGLKGGHSGCDIHLQRGNAIRLLARALLAADADQVGDIRLAGFEGGRAHNAIPREAFATLVVAAKTREAVLAAVTSECARLQDEYRPADPDIVLEVRDAPTPEHVWDQPTTRTVLRLLNGLPHGVAAMSYEIPDLVETSSNLATVRRQNGSLAIELSSRSSIDSALDAMRQQIRSLALLAGADVEEPPAYPGWKPNLDSDLLRVVSAVHTRELGSTPEVKAIHAGLECGILGKKIPGMDMISFGPVIEFPHSPDERVEIGSVARFYRLLTAVLAGLI